MRQVSSSSLADFAAIYDDDVELVCVNPQAQNPSLRRAANALVTKPSFTTQWSQAANDVKTARDTLARSLDPSAVEALAAQINLASDMLGCLLDCNSVGIRIATLTAPMCPRFHVDRVPCRLLFTLAGQGTEWIPNSAVDPVKFEDRYCIEDPLTPGGSVERVPIGVWALLKGGAWSDGFAGVVHRSPRDAQPRLLVSLDPLFDA